MFWEYVSGIHPPTFLPSSLLPGERK